MWSNEALFLVHILFVLGLVFGALRAGLAALVGLTVVQVVIANIFVSKQIMLFGLSVTAADVFIVGAVVGINLLQEYYGALAARGAVWATLWASTGFVILSRIHLAYVPHLADVSQRHFQALFSHTPRIVIASIVATFVAQYFERWLYSLLQKRWADRALSLRTTVSLAIGQLLDTGLFSFLGLYGIVASVGDIMIMSLAVKGVVIALMGPLSALARFVVRNDEHRLP
jgi:uncharacterized integral membrane protein (TIGR00697 family)